MQHTATHWPQMCQKRRIWTCLRDAFDSWFYSACVWAFVFFECVCGSFGCIFCVCRSLFSVCIGLLWTTGPADFSEPHFLLLSYFLWKPDISSFWNRTSFEFIFFCTEEFEFLDLVDLGLWHFHWNLSYSVRIHADMFQYRIFCYFFNFFYLNLFEADMFLPMSHVTYDAITA